MMSHEGTSDYATLIEAACRSVEANEYHACRTTPECRLLGGCPKCGMAVMRGLTVGVERIEVSRRTGVVRLHYCIGPRGMRGCAQRGGGRL
jgi:hypothetical protein